MIIKTIESPDGPYEPRGWLETIIETKDGTRSANFGAGEPEDFSLARGLNDAYEIKDMLLMAYKAGQRSEGLTIEHKDVE